jgi:hypothetical protein
MPVPARKAADRRPRRRRYNSRYNSGIGRLLDLAGSTLGSPSASTDDLRIDRRSPHRPTISASTDDLRIDRRSPHRPTISASTDDLRIHRRSPHPPTIERHRPRSPCAYCLDCRPILRHDVFSATL